MNSSPGRLRAPLFVTIDLLILLELLDLLPGLNAVEDLVRFPLSPNEIIVLPIIVVTHAPPKSALQCCSDYPRVVTSAYIVFIRSKTCRRKLDFFDSV